VTVDLEYVSDARHKAEQAAQLLKNDAFNDAFAGLMADIEKQLFMTDPSAREERETLYHLHRAAQMFVNNIASRVNHLVLNESDD
jgi:hypothetical protein